jgi:hypothetical protein
MVVYHSKYPSLVWSKGHVEILVLGSLPHHLPMGTSTNGYRMGYKWVTKVKSYINSVEVHPQLSHNGHPVDGWCAGGCWFTLGSYEHGFLSHLGT